MDQKSMYKKFGPIIFGLKTGQKTCMLYIFVNLASSIDAVVKEDLLQLLLPAPHSPLLMGYVSLPLLQHPPCCGGCTQNPEVSGDYV